MNYQVMHRGYREDLTMKD